MALAKELAALKLYVLFTKGSTLLCSVLLYEFFYFYNVGIWLQSRVSDLSLDEEGVLKLASFGNEANNKDTIDILKRSLVIRNK